MPQDVAKSLDALIARREEALRPANEHEIAVVLGRLVAHFGAPDRPEEHHRIVFEDWLCDLAEYPFGVLDDAATEWRRTKPWAPKICELRALCDADVGRRRAELARLRFMRWCVKQHGGQCPRMMRQIGEHLADYGDPISTHIIEAAMAGQTKFPGDRVLAFPGAVLAPPQHDPAIVEHRQRVRDVLADAGFSAAERLQLGDITEERAAALSAGRIAERERSACRQRVLQILLNGGFGIPEIERRSLLDLGEDAALALLGERARHAAAIAAAEAAAPGNDTVQ